MQYDQNFFPWDDIPDSGVLLDGMYQMRGESLNIEITSTGKRMITMQAIVEQPENYANMRIFENFVIGTDNDKMGQMKETWLASIGARRFKGLLKAANVPQSNDLQQICATFPGVMFLAQATQYTEKGGDYAGTTRNRFNFYRIGEKTVGVTGKSPVGLGAPAVMPTFQPQPQPQVQPAPQVQPTPQPQPQPQPQLNVVQPQPQAEAVQEVLIPCGNCQKSFPASQFQAHVNQCLQG